MNGLHSEKLFLVVFWAKMESGVATKKLVSWKCYELLATFKILHPLYITESRVLSWSWQNWIFQNLRKSPNILLKAVWFAENGNKFDDIILVGKCIWLANITLCEIYTFTFEASTTAWKVSTYWVFSGPYFSSFRPEKTPYLSTFHVVYALRKRKFFYYHMI